jgi:hypothetical protein
LPEWRRVARSFKSVAPKSLAIWRRLSSPARISSIWMLPDLGASYRRGIKNNNRMIVIGGRLNW